MYVAAAVDFYLIRSQLGSTRRTAALSDWSDAMPLAAGIAGAVLLPFWVAVGAIVALATDFTILVERDPDLPAK